MDSMLLDGAAVKKPARSSVSGALPKLNLFLASSALAIAIAALTITVKNTPKMAFPLPEQHPEGSPEERIVELGLTVPPPRGANVGTYIPVGVVGDLLYLSGVTPVRPDGTPVLGKVTANVTGVEFYTPEIPYGYIDVDQAYMAARMVGLMTLAEIKNHIGSLDRVVRFVKVVGLVNASPEFTMTPQVINGYSDLMISVFGEAGRSPRTAVGLTALPGGAPVEIEAIVQFRP